MENHHLLKLSSNILRKISLKLSLADIANFCQTNSILKTNIIDNKIFWEEFLKEIDEKIEIPKNVKIEWYKDKIQKWNKIKPLITLIKENKIKVKYIQFFNPNWNSFQIVQNIREIDCNGNNLSFLPEMPNVKILYCYNNDLISLPLYSKLEELYCGYNRLKSLSSMPNLKVLLCRSNRLTILPYYPKLDKLCCDKNPLPFFTLEEWAKYWKNI